mmetsp:Transcript_21806/g.33725  ORF Transcript_21806/g.33725 Transcript_21806/m.33725 type:complete len:145 (-) Transcript_21806:838-1272(-)|eukprot:CAMPEP_0170506722 /NCGR_PEP_ID=MMETSP0208-20121228/55963_1 /TAXON_ID=197538 /ORGANISM="Strombidium inclinatum, Strain S3" /LENGTH=144 /DNA_ID=CAMNT_0010788427 /DNA_START=302 /DNA_END=736 /DNA_ORIENTATION=+
MATSVWGFVLLFSLSFGIANGLTYIVPLHLAWSYFRVRKDSDKKGREGLITGIVVAGFGLGGLVFDFASSELMNPEQIDPQDEEAFPFPKEVADNLPHTMQRLAFWWALIIIVAMVLVQSEPAKKEEVEEDIREMVSQRNSVTS